MDERPACASDKLVLIVDDDHGIRELLRLLVDREGFRVETAEDGAEALEKTRTLAPHLILLDLTLPGADGLEILGRLRAGETKGIPVIIMTGRALDRSTAELLQRERDVVEYLEKPLRTEKLTSLLHKTLKTLPPARRPAP